MSVPRCRIHPAIDAAVRPDGRFVLYWMTASRRLSFNFALDRAVELARELRRPLVILEALRAGYPHASDRHHAFVLQGMAEHRRDLVDRPVTFHAYVEPEPGSGRGLVAELGREASVVVTDLHPGFFLPRMVEAAARQLDVRFERVDSCGLLPLSATTGAFKTARSFRRHLQRELPSHLDAIPKASPLARLRLPRLRALPRAITTRWPFASDELLATKPRALRRLPIDHGVGMVAREGGTAPARAALRAFLQDKLERYPVDRNHPDAQGSSGLSPWLHFGHLSPHEVAFELLGREGWHPGDVGRVTDGTRSGFWGASEAADQFLEQLVTWRELGLNMAWHRRDAASYEALPAWARDTLQAHASDARERLYDLEALESADTDDPIWNAAQRELVDTGTMHNYLRMLWGKRILGWTAHPRDAHAAMLELNDRYALDGRDPNSVSGILWVLGRYDRPWGPERPVFGTVRYMSSANTARKLRLRGYLARHGAGAGQR